MQRLAFIFLLVYSGFLPTSGRVFCQENKLVKTEHLIISWKEDIRDDEIEAAKERGEKFYLAIHKLLGHDVKSKITILLRGPAEQADGSWGYPHVDSWGRINLFKFGPELESYFSALAHEMVHVFRFRRSVSTDWFFEEGFAEFVARRVDPSMQGFPWYGFSITVVAGQWIANGEDIPLATLRERHRTLNLPCKAQSYSLRASFFDYLGKKYGDDAVLDMASQENAGELSGYRKLFKKNFDELENEWREALITDHKNTKNVTELAKQYRHQTPMQYMQVCKKGDDFD